MKKSAKPAKIVVRTGAIAAITCAILATPAFASGFTIGSTLGQSCYEEAKWGRSDIDALKTCNRALNDSLLPYKDRAATYINRGIVRSARGDLKGALNDYDAALRISPELGEAFANKGAAYLRVEEYQKAIALLNTALEHDLLKPENVYFNRSVAYESLGKPRLAYEDLKTAARIAPQWVLPQIELLRYQVISD